MSGAVGQAGGALQSGISGKGTEDKDLGSKASETAGKAQDKTIETVGEAGGKASATANDAKQKVLGDDA